MVRKEKVVISGRRRHSFIFVVSKYFGSYSHHFRSISTDDLRRMDVSMEMESYDTRLNTASLRHKWAGNMIDITDVKR